MNATQSRHRDGMVGGLLHAGRIGNDYQAGVSSPVHELRIFYQLLLDGVTHQFGLVVHVHFLQDARLVRAHGLDGERQPLGDLGYGLAGHQTPEHVELSVGKALLAGKMPWR